MKNTFSDSVSDENLKMKQGSNSYYTINGMPMGNNPSSIDGFGGGTLNWSKTKK